MFGIYRAILAVFVVIEHLGNAPLIGNYSVFGFYILSGYLMTRIMHKTYGYNCNGVIKYLSNRFLRIYPLYWLSIFFSILLLLLISKNIVTSISQSIFFPHDLEGILRNIFIIFSINTEPRLTPPSWALTVELFYYLLIAFGCSKTRNITIAWFLLSVFYTIYLIYNKSSFSYRYFTILSASLPFSLGAILFFVPPRQEESLALKVIITVLLIVFNYFFSLHENIGPGFGFYINLFLFSYVISVLIKIKNDRILKYDVFWGNLSYPVYLLHYQCGVVVYFIFSFMDIRTHKGEFLFCAASIFLCLFISYLTSIILENRIEFVRSKIRPHRI